MQMGLSVQRFHQDIGFNPKQHPYNPHHHTFLKKVVRFLKGEKSVLADPIKKLAKAADASLSSDEKIASVLKAVESIDYSSLKTSLRKIIKKMSDKERKSLLKRALRQDFEKGEKFLGNQCLHLMTVKQLRSIAKHTSDSFIDVKSTAKEVKAIHMAMRKYDVQEEHVKLIKREHQFFLFKLLKNFIQTIAVALNLLELGKEPNTYFETKYLLDIYWQLFEIPIKILKFIFSTIANPLINVAVIFTGTLISAITAPLFKKLGINDLKNLPYCKNLSVEILKGKIKPVFGREKELDEILESLAANNEFGRKHPLIIGKKGVGKTELMNGLAWRLAQGKVPPTLKQVKTLFIINCGELTKKMKLFDLADPLELIMNRVKGHQKEMIIIFDEAECLVDELGVRFNSLLDTSPDSLFYAIGITTLSSYKKKLKNTDLERRFSKIPLEETTEEQTIAILRQINQQAAPDIEFSESAFTDIYKQSEEMSSRFHPDKDIFVMSQAIEKIRHLQNGGAYAEDLHDLMTTRENLASQLSQKKIHGLSIHSDEIKELMVQINETDTNIRIHTNDIKKKRLEAKAFANLRKQRDYHEGWFYEMSNKIASGSIHVSKTLEKAYLFNSFVFLPKLNKYLKDFVSEHDLEVKVLDEMITDIVDNLIEQESIED